MGKKIVHRGNVFLDPQSGLPGEQVEELVRAPGARIERIVSTGQSSPEGFWYDQDHDEWAIVLKGRAGLQLEGDEAILEMSAGDWLIIPAHRRHRVAWTAEDEPTIWLAVHF